MGDRPRDRRSAGPPARGPAQGPAFLIGLIAIARLGLLAITFYGVVNLVAQVFHSNAISRTVGAPRGVTSLSLILAAASAALMVALVVNAAFLVDRLFARRLVPSLIVAVFALAAASIGLGFQGSQQLAIVATGFLVLPALGFVFSMLLARVAGPMPGKRPGAAPASSTSATAQRSARARQRQRRGGRKH
jgi:hypothetical protein